MPKTQIMTDDKGRPFVGHKAMRGGNPVYVRRSQLGTGTTNPFEALGRMINPGSYKDNDQRLLEQKQKISIKDMHLSKLNLLLMRVSYLQLCL